MFCYASRANYGRIKPVLQEVRKNKKINLQIVLTASSVLERFGDLTPLLLKDRFKVSKKCYVMVEGGNPITMAKSTGISINELSSIFDEIKPDIVVTTGDRFETLATAIAASYMNIKVAHIQGGEITGSIDESVRHAVTKLSHIHFASTEKSKKNIIKMGEDPMYVFNTGCPSIDLIKKKRLSLKKIFSKNKGVGNKVDEKEDFILVLFHPVTTEYDKIKQQIKILSSAIEKINHQVLWLWPNIDAGTDLISKYLRKLREKNKLENVTFFKNFEAEDYLVILENALCAIGNSSSFIREGSYIKLPTVLVGNRQNKREVAKNIIFSKINENEILKKYKIQIRKKKKLKQSFLYGKETLQKL